MPNSKLLKEDLIYPELSYKIVGILFEVYKQLGSKYQEKYYQKALVVEFTKAGLAFTEQVRIPLNYKETIIGSYVLDFVIESKIALEIKKNDNFSYKNIEQVISIS
jgi:GxxExxY protein